MRNAFTAIAPGLAQPVDPACLAAITDPGRTMLGARQYAAFTRAIAASTATWKVVVNEVPIQQFYALPYDRWEGYAAERERLLAFLQQRVRNVVFLTTDSHANFVNEIRLRSLDPTGPGGTGIWEVITGPVATNSYSREVDEAIGVPGAGAAITGLFLKVPPPRGPGMACAAPDVYSYAQVRGNEHDADGDAEGRAGPARARADRRALRPVRVPRRPLGPARRAPSDRPVTVTPWSRSGSSGSSRGPCSSSSGSSSPRSSS